MHSTKYACILNLDEDEEIRQLSRLNSIIDLRNDVIFGCDGWNKIGIIHFVAT